MQLVIMFKIINGTLSICIGSIALAHFSFDFLEGLMMDMGRACLFLLFVGEGYGVVGAS